MSRKDFDLEKLRPHGMIVGCNWLYRDFSPDIIVGLDVEPRKEIRKLRYPEDRSWKFLTWAKDRANLNLEGEHAMPVIQINRTAGKNSGIISISYLSKVERCDKVYLLGFDFFRIHPGMKQHDIYQPNCLFRYKNFEKAFNVLFSDCQHTKFTRVGPEHPFDAEYYGQMKPYCDFIDYPEFEERLATNRL